MPKLGFAPSIDSFIVDTFNLPDFQSFEYLNGEVAKSIFCSNHTNNLKVKVLFPSTCLYIHAVRK